MKGGRGGMEGRGGSVEGRCGKGYESEGRGGEGDGEEGRGRRVLPGVTKMVWFLPSHQNPFPPSSPPSPPLFGFPHPSPPPPRLHFPHPLANCTPLNAFLFHILSLIACPPLSPFPRHVVPFRLSLAGRRMCRRLPMAGQALRHRGHLLTVGALLPAAITRQGARAWRGSLDGRCNAN